MSLQVSCEAAVCRLSADVDVMRRPVHRRVVLILDSPSSPPPIAPQLNANGRAQTSTLFAAIDKSSEWRRRLLPPAIDVCRLSAWVVSEVALEEVALATSPRSNRSFIALVCSWSIVIRERATDHKMSCPLPDALTVIAMIAVEHLVLHTVEHIDQAGAQCRYNVRVQLSDAICSHVECRWRCAQFAHDFHRLNCCSAWWVK